MVAILAVVSFSAGFARAAHAMPAVHAARPAIGAPSGGKAIPAKMCRRMVLPGTANACPLSSFSIGAVFGAPNHGPRASATVAAGWRLNDAPLPAQRSGLGLYRPPRARA